MNETTTAKRRSLPRRAEEESRQMEKSTWGINERHPQLKAPTTVIFVCAKPHLPPIPFVCRQDVGAFNWGCLSFQSENHCPSECKTRDRIRPDVGRTRIRPILPTRPVKLPQVDFSIGGRLCCGNRPRFAAEGGRARVVRRSQGYLIEGDRPSGTPSAFGIGWQAHPGYRTRWSLSARNGEEV